MEQPKSRTSFFICSIHASAFSNFEHFHAGLKETSKGCGCVLRGPRCHDGIT